jgi:hypothetical protein
MSPGAQNEGRHITTDRGLAPASGLDSKKATDPGVAPPSSQPAVLEVMDPNAATAPTPPPVAAVPAVPLAAVPRAPNVLDASPELPPIATRVGGDPTPVPETTDGLLNGLIASENEAYFRRAKPAAASSGEAAAAFHGDPHPVAPGNPTPPPEPPVLLRRSVEMDIEEAARIGSRPRDRSEVTTEPNPLDLPIAQRSALEGPSPDPTIELPEPRPAWTEKAVAFGIAVLAVGAIGLLLLRWLSTDDGKTTAPPASTAPPVVQTAAPLPPVSGTAIPPPQPASSPEPTPMAEAQPPPKSTVRGTSATPPAPRTIPRASHSAEGPQEAVPPPKDDVKRSM